MIRSFRVRLLLWNAAVLALAMAGFGLALIYLNQARMAAAIDRELNDRVARALRTGPFGGQPPMPMDPPAQGQDQPGENRGGQRPPPDRMGQGPELPAGPPFSDLRRPRFFGTDGSSRGRFADDDPLDPHSLQAALRGQRLYANVTSEGARLRVLTAPVRREGQIRGAVQAARELDELEHFFGEQIRTLLLFLPLALGCALAGSYWLTNRALRPIAAVTESASQITATDLSKRLEVQGQDELSQLARTFNDMLSRLEGAFVGQREAYEKLESAYENQRRFTADASHELRTPLTRLRLATGAGLASGATDEERLRALQVADNSGKLMTNLVQQLLTLSRADAGQLNLRMEPLDLRLPVSEAVEQLTGGPIEPKVIMANSAVIVDGDEMHLRRIVVNLLENAVRHTPADGLIEVEVAVAGAEALVRVSDTGEGIAPEHLTRIFDRFYRVDSARTSSESAGGTGLGLAICKSIAEAHGGRIEAASVVGEGTTLKVFLPISKFK